MRCFVIMPYGNWEKDPQRRRELDSLYDHCIRPAVEAVTLPQNPGEHIECHRGDKESAPGEIIKHIIENLVLSEVAIADLTGRIRCIGRSIFARFKWSGLSGIAGYAQFTIENQDFLRGGWWCSDEVPDENEDITRISTPSMEPWELRRVPGKAVFPKWAADFFREREEEVSQSQGRS